MDIKSWIEKIYGKNHFGNMGVNGRMAKGIFVCPKQEIYKLSDH
jgi:hypothetical protein